MFYGLSSWVYESWPKDVNQLKLLGTRWCASSLLGDWPYPFRIFNNTLMLQLMSFGCSIQPSSRTVKMCTSQYEIICFGIDCNIFVTMYNHIKNHVYPCFFTPWPCQNELRKITGESPRIEAGHSVDLDLRCATGASFLRWSSFGSSFNFFLVVFAR